MAPLANTTSGIQKLNILVTGGSGSLGRNIIKVLLKKGARNITSINRDEQLLREAEIEVGSPYVSFKLGDIGDQQLIPRLMKETDVVFHTAALKHVSLAEKNPREFNKVNVSSLLNLLDNSENISRFIHISSDKAIGVVNCYGATKLLGEYLVRETNNLYKNGSKYIIIRCPNFFASRGSVLDVWKKQLSLNNKIEITDPEMTRYFVTLYDAASYIVDIGLSDNTSTKSTYYPLKFTQKYKLKDLAEAFIEVFGNAKTKLVEIGALPGEKKHEDYIEDVKLTSKTELKKLLRNLI